MSWYNLLNKKRQDLVERYCLLEIVNMYRRYKFMTYKVIRRALRGVALNRIKK